MVTVHQAETFLDGVVSEYGVVFCPINFIIRLFKTMTMQDHETAEPMQVVVAGGDRKPRYKADAAQHTDVFEARLTAQGRLQEQCLLRLQRACEGLQLFLP